MCSLPTDLTRMFRIFRRHAYLAGVTIASLAVLMLTGCMETTPTVKEVVVYSLKPIDVGPLADPCIPQEPLTAADNASEDKYLAWDKRNLLNRRTCETNHEELVRIFREKGVIAPAARASAASQ